MKQSGAWVLAGLLLLSSLATAGEDHRRELLLFRKGKSSATVSGTVRGYRYVDYQLQAAAGQRLVVSFTPTSPSAYFNILPPGSDEALFVGSTSGNRFDGELPADGCYTVRVYLMRSAARRKESARYTLTAKLTGEGRSNLPPFERSYELQGIRFHISSTLAGSINTLRIVPSGLEIDNSPIVRTIDGTVSGAEAGDINGDGSPEIYVYVTSSGSGSYGSLVAFSANRRKSLSEIYLPPVAQDAKHAAGYRGHDQFAIGEGVLLHRFPRYRDSDSNARPTGGTRQLQYRLVPGEAGWLLVIDRVVEY